MRRQLPTVIYGRNAFLSVLVALFAAFGLLVFDVDKPITPSGPIAIEIVSTIERLALASGTTFERKRCRMVTKQYIVVICEIEHLHRSDATRTLLSEGWTVQGTDEALSQFSRGSDHLSIEEGRADVTTVSVIRRF